MHGHTNIKRTPYVHVYEIMWKKTQNACLRYRCNKGYANAPLCYISNRRKAFRTAQPLGHKTLYTLREENAITEKLKIKEIVTDTFIWGVGVERA